jgi:beta-glucosidase/6-phospho-beta-glucosidase/beta-galactosidase/ABC-type amino acid transport substrate-binding protein
MSFRFGVATADHQCEAHVDGADDIRDVWERVRGETRRGMATDFWNRYLEDIKLAADLGCKIFRISLSWARLEPRPNEWSDDALGHYRDVLKAIRDAGMESIVTLLHNTWPLHVQECGNGAGLLDEGFPDKFARYARYIAEHLGDGIDYYITLNEPNQLTYGFVKPWWSRSYAMPPGLDRFASTSDQMHAVSRLMPNLFLANSRARAMIREIRPGAQVGANPFLLGLPGWLQQNIDKNVMRIDTQSQLEGQGRRMTERPFLDSGKVDAAIAQLTMTSERMNEVLFSESYFDAKMAALRLSSRGMPQQESKLDIRIGVTESTTATGAAHRFFPSATIQTYAELPAAVAALKAGSVDAIVGDDVILRPYATVEMTLTGLSDEPQPFGVAVAMGKRTLLNAIDLAIRGFKLPDETGISPWARSMKSAFPSVPPTNPPVTGRRATIARGDVSAQRAAQDADHTALPLDVPPLDRALDDIRRRGVLRIGVHDGAPGLCETAADGSRRGLEPDVARFIAQRIFGDKAGRVEFVQIEMKDRVNSPRPLLHFLDPLLQLFSVFTTIINTNWWNLGLAGRLSTFLCPAECVGALDFVGLDYYWGIDALGFGRIARLMAAAEGRYANAPVWPSLFRDIVKRQHELFPDLPIIVVENGCVTAADGLTRSQYLVKHIAEIQRAVADGIPVTAYLCWSLTSNREWGLPFDDNSDFGLYHIDLDRDPSLKRVNTPAAETYRAIIAARSAG